MLEKSEKYEQENISCLHIPHKKNCSLHYLSDISKEQSLISCDKQNIGFCSTDLFNKMVFVNKIWQQSILLTDFGILLNKSVERIFCWCILLNKR